MIEKIDTNQIQDISEKTMSKPTNAAGTVGNNRTDVSLQIDYASFIAEAIQIPEADAKAVQKAQEMLLSGQLESMENIRAAAENIVKFGI